MTDPAQRAAERIAKEAWPLVVTGNGDVLERLNEILEARENMVAGFVAIIRSEYATRDRETDVEFHAFKCAYELSEIENKRLRAVLANVLAEVSSYSTGERRSRGGNLMKPFDVIAFGIDPDLGGVWLEFGTFDSRADFLARLPSGEPWRTVRCNIDAAPWRAKWRLADLPAAFLVDARIHTELSGEAAGESDV